MIKTVTVSKGYTDLSINQRINLKSHYATGSNEFIDKYGVNSIPFKNAPVREGIIVKL